MSNLIVFWCTWCFHSQIAHKLMSIFSLIPLVTITEHKHSDNDKFKLYNKLNKEESFERDEIWTVDSGQCHKSLYTRNCVDIRGYSSYLVKIKSHHFNLLTMMAQWIQGKKTWSYMSWQYLLQLDASPRPLTIFDNTFMQRYIHALNPKHRSPHRLERVRIVKVIMDYCMAELAKMLNKRHWEELLYLPQLTFGLILIERSSLVLLWLISLHMNLK
jgi:hypothetical protein